MGRRKRTFAANQTGKFAPHAKQNNDKRRGRGPYQETDFRGNAEKFVVLVPGRTRVENQCQKFSRLHTSKTKYADGENRVSWNRTVGLVYPELIAFCLALMRDWPRRDRFFGFRITILIETQSSN